MINLNSEKIIKQYLLKNKNRKLHIGCGKNILEGWLNTDLIGSDSSEIAILDAGKKFPFQDATFDYVYSEHVFEHLAFEQGYNMISEIYRILKPNGYVRIATPDLNFLMRLYQYPELSIHKDYISWSFNKYSKNIGDLLDGDDNAAVYVNNNFYRDWGHQIIHNFSSLKEILKKNGFIEIFRREVGSSELEEFKNIEKHNEIISSKFNDLETMVIEAKRGCAFNRKSFR